MLVKICGITNTEDALNAYNLGAWAIGYIFFKGSKRYVEPKIAGEISAELSNAEKVGVFVDEKVEDILQIAKEAKLSIIQLHGKESIEDCKAIKHKSGLKVIKAFRVKNEDDIQQIDEYRNIVDYILLDSFDDKEYGGTGKSFNWALAKLAKQKDVKIILSGGINPDNISDAIEQINPFAIDVSSGVEKQKGLKDFEKMKGLFLNI